MKYYECNEQEARYIEFIATKVSHCYVTQRFEVSVLKLELYRCLKKGW